MKLAKQFIAISSLCMGLFLVACSGANQSAVTVNTSQPQAVGADKDAHGCKASAGYQWSVLKNDCVRIFEQGIGFSAYGNNTDSTLAAFVIFDPKGQQAEVFLPHRTNGIMLVASPTIEGDIAPILFHDQENKVAIVAVKGIHYIRVGSELVYVHQVK